jgi:hypothetical protein
VSSVSAGKRSEGRLGGFRAARKDPRFAPAGAVVFTALPPARPTAFRHAASAAQNSPNTLMYRSTSGSLCCTDRVHCSSSPGVMKMPRLSNQG